MLRRARIVVFMVRFCGILHISLDAKGQNGFVLGLGSAFFQTDARRVSADSCTAEEQRLKRFAKAVARRRGQVCRVCRVCSTAGGINDKFLDYPRSSLEFTRCESDSRNWAGVISVAARNWRVKALWSE